MKIHFNFFIIFKNLFFVNFKEENKFSKNHIFKLAEKLDPIKFGPNFFVWIPKNDSLNIDVLFYI